MPLRDCWHPLRASTSPAQGTFIGIQMALTRDFDVLYLDVHLPDGTGFDVCRRVRQSKDIRQPAIVFHSATMGTPGDMNELDADGFLTYPAESGHVEAVLLGAMKKRFGSV